MVRLVTCLSFLVDGLSPLPTAFIRPSLNWYSTRYSVFTSHCMNLTTGESLMKIEWCNEVNSHEYIISNQFMNTLTHVEVGTISVSGLPPTHESSVLIHSTQALPNNECQSCAWYIYNVWVLHITYAYKYPAPTKLWLTRNSMRLSKIQVFVIDMASRHRHYSRDSSVDSA